MTRRSPLPAPFDSGPFNTADALAAGISPKRLCGRDLSAPFSGVRTINEPVLPVELAGAFLPRMTEKQYFSHLTAALIYGTPLPWRLERERVIHVSVNEPNPRPQRAGVRGHVSDQHRPLRVVGGARVLAPAHAWCELAAYLDHDALVAAGDHLVRRKRPASTIEQLAAAVAEHGSRRHARALRAALRDIRRGTDSPMETRLRLLIVASGLPEPVVGYTVTHEHAFVGTPDLAYPALKIAIEYEGTHHQEDRAIYSDDIARREAFERAGWKVILVLKEHLAQSHRIVSRIREAIAERTY